MVLLPTPPGPSGCQVPPGGCRRPRGHRAEGLPSRGVGYDELGAPTFTTSAWARVGPASSDGEQT